MTCPECGNDIPAPASDGATERCDECGNRWWVEWDAETQGDPSRYVPCPTLRPLHEQFPCPNCKGQGKVRGELSGDVLDCPLCGGDRLDPYWETR